ncbi:hypothetical protein [Celeribacter neptunius]|uniref:Uncharacterized protein n=1 Tax=Celeribacter neptunius TaxID=588602 RepID=A0A1I3IIF2_9RHOB|nr:hypothetical protein [Celeribacter neptunius]SFI47617.1 hypothetical protein SAMN04487991_0017 [Celeribacter neptunius]
MSRPSWHISEVDGALTLARRLPARFDVSATAVIKGGAGLGKARIAHQVRQDMWRALQNLRGFAPVVQVTTQGEDLEITAGGTIAGRFPKSEVEARIAALLAEDHLQSRWVRFAQPRQRQEA